MDHLGRIILVVVISTLLGSTPLRSQAQLMLGLRIGSFSAATHFGPRFTYCDSLPLWFQGSLTISDHGAYSTMHDYHDPLLRCNPFRNHPPVFKIHTWWGPGSYYKHTYTSPTIRIRGHHIGRITPGAITGMPITPPRCPSSTCLDTLMPPHD